MLEILLAVIYSLVVVQGIKGITESFKRKKLEIKNFYKTGGMPSSHAAVVSALALSIYYIEGLSTGFIISLVLAMIVMRDAMGVRRTVGEEVIVLRKLLRKHRLRSKVHDAPGHTPLQVIFGALVGVSVTVLMHAL
tara:strand:- start:4432 stop:4839 length:408 start_codon:yes stop_codon:yes gene_type:complete